MSNTSNLRLIPYDEEEAQEIQNAVTEMIAYIKDAGDAWRNDDIDQFFSAADEIESYAEDIIGMLEGLVVLKDMSQIILDERLIGKGGRHDDE